MILLHHAADRFIQYLLCYYGLILMIFSIESALLAYS